MKSGYGLFMIFFLCCLYTTQCYAVTPPAAPTVVWNDMGANSDDTQKVTVSGVLPPDADRLYYKLSANNTYYYYGPATELSHQFTDIADEQSVYAYLVAYDSMNNYSSYSSSSPAVLGDRTPPPVPVTPNTPLLQWNDMGINSRDEQMISLSRPSAPSGVDKWKVSYCYGEGTDTSEWIDISEVVCADTGLGDEQTVKYKIKWRDYDENGNFSDSAESPYASVDIGDRTPPPFESPAVTVWNDMGPNSQDTQKVTVSLGSFPPDTASMYYTLIANATSYKYGPIMDLSHQFTMVNDSQTVWGSITAYDSAGNYSISSSSATITDRTSPLVPSAPVLVWQDQGPNSQATQVVVVSGTMPTDANRIHYKLVTQQNVYYHGPTTSLSHEFQNIYDSQTVYGYLRAYDAENNYSAYSTGTVVYIEDRTPPTAPPAPAKPVIVWDDMGPNSADTQKVTINNSTPPENVTHWRVSYSSGAGTSISPLLPVSTTSFQDVGVCDEQTVYYKIQWRKYDTEGNWANGPESQEAFIYIQDRTAPAIPSEPDVVWNDMGANSQDTQRVTLSGATPSDANRIQYKLSANDTCHYYGPTTELSHQFIDICDEQTAYGSVMAYDALNNYSVYSSSRAVVIGDRTPPSLPSTPDMPCVEWIDRGKNSMDTQRVNIVKSTHPLAVDYWRVSYSSGAGTDTTSWLDVSISTWQDTDVHDRQTVRYGIKWRDYDENGNFSDSAESPYASVDIGDRTPPAVPQNLSAIAGDASIDLCWSPNQEGDMAGYNIYCDTGDGFSFLSFVPAPSAVYKDGDLTNYRNYSYGITAVDNDGNESVCSTIETCYPDPDIDKGPPAPVTDLVAQPGISEGYIDLKWTAPGDDGTLGVLYTDSMFGIQYSSYVASWQIYNCDIIISTSGVSLGDRQYYTLRGLYPGTTYYFRLWTADNLQKWSAISNGATAWAGPDVTPPEPNPPEIIKVKTESSTSITWEAGAGSDNNGVNYYFEGSAGAYGWTKVSSHTFTGLIPNTSYYETVRLKDNFGNSTGISGSSVCWTFASVPGNLSCLGFGGEPNSGTGYINISWTPESNPEYTVYEVYCISSSSMIYSGTETEYSHTGLCDRTTYYYKVRAKNEFGIYTVYTSTGYAVTKDRTPPSVPSAPVLVWNDMGPNSADNQKITLSGILPQGASKLYFKLLGDGVTFYYGPSEVLSHAFENIGDEQVVYGWLRGYDSENNYSDYSSSSSVIIPDRTPPPVPTVPSPPLVLWTDRGLGSGDTQEVTITKSTHPLAVDYWRVSYSSGAGTDTSEWIDVSIITFQDTEVCDNQEVRYRIKFRDCDGNGNFSDSLESPESVVNIADRTGPSKPVNFIAMPGNRFINLQWDPCGEPDLNRYDIYRDTGAGFLFLDFILPPACAYHDPDLINHNTYYYRIKAKDNLDNESPYSDIKECYPYDDTAPSRITDLTASGGTYEGEIRLLWTAPGDDGTAGNASSYVIRWSNDPLGTGNWNSAKDIASPPVPSPPGRREDVTVTGLVPGTTYYFGIVAYDEENNPSLLSNSPGIVALDLIPQPPENLILLRGEADVMLNWSANKETDINHYNIYRNNRVGEDIYCLIASTRIPSYFDDELPQAVTYWYKITAIDNTANESGYSVPVSTYIIPTPPSQPSDFSGTAISTSSIRWTWKDNGKNETGFRVCNSTGGVLLTLERNTTCWIEKNLSANTSYYRYVQAYNTLASATSGAGSLFTLAVTPSLLTSLSQTGSSISLSWTQSNATCYAVQRAYDAGGSPGPWEFVIWWDNEWTLSYFDDAGLTCDTLFWYRVRAYNGNGILTLPGNEIRTKTKDIFSPEKISSLIAIPGTYEGEIMLTWTAPGDNGMNGDISDGEYEIRWSTNAQEAWNSMDFVSFPITSVSPWTGQCITITGLCKGATYFFWIKTRDEVFLWSSLSNAATAYAQNDIIGPSPVTLYTGNITYTSIELKWIAPGDNGDMGRASAYDIRYSTTGPVDSLDKFNAATPVRGVFSPAPAGEEESCTVGDLKQRTVYYFAIRASDEVPIWSSLSNSPSAETLYIEGNAPSSPPGVKGMWASDGERFNLEWSKVKINEDGSLCTDLKGYNIYRASRIKDSYVLCGFVLSGSVLSWTEPADIAGQVVYYVIRAVDVNNNESKNSFIVDTTTEENTISVSEDGNAVLKVPKKLRNSLYKDANGYGQDIIIRITETENGENEKVVCSYEIKAIGAEDGKEIKNFSFSKSKAEITLSYPGSEIYIAGSKSSSIAQQGVPLGIYWFDGMEYINLGGTVDTGERTVTVRFRYLGSYRIQEVLRAAELHVTDVWPRKTFTPNSDGINDTFNIRFENLWDSNIYGYIYDITGTLIAELKRDGDVLYWDGLDRDGLPAHKGVYIYECKGENKIFSGTVILAR